MPTRKSRRLGSAADLDRIRNEFKAVLEARQGKRSDSGMSQIMVCTGASCIACGALECKAALQEAVKKYGLATRVGVVETGCLGPCCLGPVAVVSPDLVFYQKLTPADATEIIEKHLLNHKPVERLLLRKVGTEAILAHLSDIDFFTRQKKIVLHNCGWIDPVRIEEYFGADGYQALARVLSEPNSDWVIEALKKSGLRGRGGAGFPTWLKWNLARQARGEKKFVICNADEGDPGAFMDRSILEGDPHAVIEAMVIAGYTIGASQGYLYVRAEYPLAVQRLKKALRQAADYGLLGKKILGSDFSFDLEIRMGSGAFVCGEETALMTSIEGKRGEPRPRPPFPVNQGLWGMPSLLNNVETYATVPVILNRGADWFATMGSERSKGTKIFALAGKVNNTGLVEIPIGTPLGEIIYDIGGGIPAGKKFKAAQIGGPSGGCIPKEHLNVPVDYESLTELGAIMGSGGLIVMDEDSCMVDVARYFLEFVQEESCGKCAPCRIGTKRMLEIVTRICEGQGRPGDIERLIDLGQKIKDTALCGLGQTAPNPVLSTIRHFRAEYEAHINEKRCPAGVCSSLMISPCQNACPAGVNVPGFVSLIGEQRYAEALRLHRERNPFASICARVCFHTCEDKCRRASLDEPVSIRSLKRFMTDQEITIQVPEIKEDPVNSGRRVAIIGAGPAGLSAAYFLARLGYRPRIFEAEPRPGGMMVQTIPAYRLPREVVAREVRMIESLGVQIDTGVRLGTDFNLEDLRNQGYEAVFLGIGAPDGIKLDIPGETADGVTDAIQLLRRYNLTGSVPIGRRVAIIGGGNAAIDAARSAVRLGAESVTIIYRRTREEMPAYAEEVEEALEEGVTLELLAAPKEILQKNGRVTGVRCSRMELGEFDRTGRRGPRTRKNEEFTVEADQVVVAVGQRINLPGVFEKLDLKLDRRGFVEVNPATGQTSTPWLFAGGDAVYGPSSVVEAIAAGERAAVGIDAYLSGAEHAFWRDMKEVDTLFDPEADPVDYGRAGIERVATLKRKYNFSEVELPWSIPIGVREAKRCLRCDYRCKK